MQRPESPSTDLQQDDGQKSQERDSWVHVEMELPANEETVGDTTIPQENIKVAPDRGDTLEVLSGPLNLTC